MALQNTARRALGCSICRQTILRSFIAGIGGTSSSAVTRRRHIQTTPSRWNEARERISKSASEEHALNDINDGFTSPIGNKAASKNEAQDSSPDPNRSVEHDHSSEQALATSSESAHIPWYLQNQHRKSPPPPEHPLSARQRIPPLPDHPPPILSPLLTHISVDLGIDDLSLLDLRSLDPPPALGANLLMLIGTARSDKHLHVSADKLCRWLRSEHDLSPYADGLLGRNELKLKLKRRAKRSKMMSRVGAKETADSEMDEGIRTGWVCVNLGRVEGGEIPRSDSREEEREFVGFNVQASGSRIVVQLMTEEKRGEVDLEKLWMAVMGKSERQRTSLELGEDGPSVEDRREVEHTGEGVEPRGADKIHRSATSYPFGDGHGMQHVRA